MPISLSNLSFTGFYYTALKFLPDDVGIEIFYEFGNDAYWERVMGELYANHPLRKLSVHGPSVSVNLADASDTRYLPFYQDVFQFAARWKAAFVVVHTNEAFSGDKHCIRRLVRRRLKELLAVSEDRQIPMVIENVGLQSKGTLLFDWRDYWELLSELPGAGALVDTGHANINRWNLPDVIQRLGSRMTACHLHDNHGMSDEHLPVGCGEIDWKPVFDAIMSSVPDCTMVFEYADTDIQTALASIDMVKRHYVGGMRISDG